MTAYNGKWLERRLSRRRFLNSGVVAASMGVAGCFGRGSQSKPPKPVALDDRQQCDECGMIISQHPGPNGEIYFAENSPKGHENPAWFDDTMACMFPYYYTHKKYGWEVSALYVTDYSAFDWSVHTMHGQQYIESTVKASAFTDGTSVYYVKGSGLHGAMGPTLIPFSARADAEALVRKHGGTILSFTEITPATLRQE